MDFDLTKNATKGGTVALIGTVAAALAPVVDAKTGGKLGAQVSLALVAGILGAVFNGVKFMFRRRKAKAAPKA